jgi:hypothetical protein
MPFYCFKKKNTIDIRFVALLNFLKKKSFMYVDCHFIHSTSYDYLFKKK